MTNLSIEPTLAELQAELETLRARVRDLEPRPAFGLTTTKRNVLIAACLVTLSLLGSAMAGSDLFYIDGNGFHFGKATIDEAGNLKTPGSVTAANLTVNGQPLSAYVKHVVDSNYVKGIVDTNYVRGKVPVPSVKIDQTGDTPSYPRSRTWNSQNMRIDNFSIVSGLHYRAYPPGGSCNMPGDCSIDISHGSFSYPPNCTVSTHTPDKSEYREHVAIGSTTTEKLFIWRGNFAKGEGTTLVVSFICVGI